MKLLSLIAIFLIIFIGITLIYPEHESKSNSFSVLSTASGNETIYLLTSSNYTFIVYICNFVSGGKVPFAFLVSSTLPHNFTIQNGYGYYYFFNNNRLVLEKDNVTEIICQISGEDFSFNSSVALAVIKSLNNWIPSFSFLNEKFNISEFGEAQENVTFLVAENGSYAELYVCSYSNNISAEKVFNLFTFQLPIREIMGYNVTYFQGDLIAMKGNKIISFITRDSNFVFNKEKATDFIERLNNATLIEWLTT
ncbi:hypothetical protein [Candidatus Acidianus copahuensis]|nr:hypothetical protein [Candidatus Acidianus copahuensis]